MVLDEGAFQQAPSISIDVAVMERADRVGVVPIDIGWSDVGTWDTIFDVSDRTSAGNAVHGPVQASGTQASLVYSDGPRIIAIDVDDLIIVATASSVLVTRRGSSQKIKEVLDTFASPDQG
jgi:mannose-1-phosphate guanylyltransferase/mannose-1-phosphate guanylyltransferase/mannose-6-phosphate isomerase